MRADLKNFIFYFTGFICPVHTPDGTPCGLLNHLSKYCEITTAPDSLLVENIPSVLGSLGMLPYHELMSSENCYKVLLDGRIIGLVPLESASQVVNNLRVLKVKGKEVRISILKKNMKANKID